MARFRDHTQSSVNSRAGRGLSRHHSAIARAGSMASARVEKIRVIHKGKEIAVKRSIYKSNHRQHVFVGNLRADVTEEQLARHFGRAGEVIEVTIRCTAGSVCVVPSSDLSRSDDSRRYASIMFKSPFVAARALSFHGTAFSDYRLFVTQNAVELPEFIDVQRKYEGKSDHVEAPVTVKSAIQCKWNALKRVTVDRTQIIPLNYGAGATCKGHYPQLLQPRPRKLLLMGMSLANAIA